MDAQIFLEAFKRRSKALQDKYTAEQEMWTRLKKLRKYLDPIGYKIIVARFHDFLTLEEAGKRFGVTRERIRQKESYVLEKIADLALSS